MNVAECGINQHADITFLFTQSTNTKPNLYTVGIFEFSKLIYHNIHSAVSDSVIYVLRINVIYV